MASSEVFAPPPPRSLDVLEKIDLLPPWVARLRHFCAQPALENARAADWVLDNDYQIARAIRELKKDMPPSFYERLPTTRGSKLPRIFGIAHCVLDATQYQLTVATVVEFLTAYQRQTPITTAELWALPSMLRLAGLELLGLAASKLAASVAAPFSPSKLALAQGMAEPGDLTAKAIMTIVAVPSIDWRAVVDQTSMVEALLRQDPAGVYARMDFETRNRYRSAVEVISCNAGTSELGVLHHCLELAREGAADDRQGHVGYWLIDEGRSELERRINYRPSAREQFSRKLRRHPGAIYLATLAVIVGAALALPLSYIAISGGGPGELALGAAVSLLPAIFLGVAILQWLASVVTRPRLLPMLDFRKGIPASCSTCVAVPVIISRKEEVGEAIERLEIRYFSNPDPVLRFVLLSDYADAPSQHLGSDGEIIEALCDGIRGLNIRHARQDGGPFVLLHRPRLYNASEKCWMGWERKRGKLSQFNAFLLTGELSAFERVEGDASSLQGTRFVITLDADTTLPPGTAAKLAGTIAHPLNRPVLDGQTNKVTKGYAIIQPRVEILPLKGPVSLFSRFAAGATAIDIYSNATSDLYQDLFGSGIFIGKGIYDVAAFEASLVNRLPTDAVLSHDMLEGFFARPGLATNIVLYEDFPANYVEYGGRLHRWIRGDWQLLPWLASKVPSTAGAKVANVLSRLDRIKIIDNLRRSLVPPGLLMLFVGGWFFLPGSAWFWTVLATLAPVAHFVGDLQSAILGPVRQSSVGDVVGRLNERLGRWFLTIAFLVSDSLLSIDAIVITLWRLVWRHQGMLEWRSAAHAGALIRGGKSRSHVWLMMWPSPFCALIMAGLLQGFNPAALPAALPILMLWLLAPEIAVWLGKPRVIRQETLNDADKALLRIIARKTWLFFETFAGPEDNWLPPDNYQEAPKVDLAHRTSPTNVGLFLAGAKAAHDQGFLSTNDLVLRLGNAMDALERVESYRGHVLNWFDTRTLAPLEPRYVSTVDSGNLAVSLIAVREGCREMADAPCLEASQWRGLSDTLAILFSSVRELSAPSCAAVQPLEREFAAAINAALAADADWDAIVLSLTDQLLPELDKAIGQCIAGSGQANDKSLLEIKIWLERVHHHVRALGREMNSLMPWLPLTGAPPSGMEGVARTVGTLLSLSKPISEIVTLERQALAPMEEQDVAYLDRRQRQWCEALREAVIDGLTRQQELLDAIRAVSVRCEAIAYGMDFSFLYDSEARLFRIGYNVSTGQPDQNHYDLLATEARLASFFAIAKQDVEIEHWFSLGRPITRLKGRPAVLSWNGSMFEYLMPPIFLPSHRDTLLGESEMAAVHLQRDYARERNLPWGISESAFAATDNEGIYQYRAFGVPSLGLRRGLSDDFVVAPYASALALCCWPKAAVRNLRHLQELGALGVYGLHDAIDFTASRVPPGAPFRLVRNYMAHHHGMTILAIANALDDDIFVRRALSGRRMQTVEQLLLERVPWDAPIETGRLDEERLVARRERSVQVLPSWVPSPHSAIPQINFLGNGNMASWMSASGAGGLKLGPTNLSRWHPTATGESPGYWIYIRDAKSGELWSASRQPSGVSSADAAVIFHPHLTEIFQRSNGIAVRMEIYVSPADDAEIREITVTNDGDSARQLEFTSYLEVVLAAAAEDERHPAFSKLFVQTQYLAEGIVLATRRPRRPELRPASMLQALVADDAGIMVTGYETDRAQFLGRGGRPGRPAGLDRGLSKTTGFTLDPILSLQTAFELAPRQTRNFALVTVAGHAPGDMTQVARRHSLSGLKMIKRDASLAAARDVNRLGLEPDRLPELQVLASLMLTPHPAFRQAPDKVGGHGARQPDLWQFGVSGDYPIIMLRIERMVPASLLDLLIRARRLWERSALRSDLIVLLSEPEGYESLLRDRALEAIRNAEAERELGARCGIHLITVAAMSQETLAQLAATAMIVIDDDEEALTSKLDRVLERHAEAMLFQTAEEGLDIAELESLSSPGDLLFHNGIGGFDPGSGDYVIHLDKHQKTPAPWCNVIANDQFGTIVDEAGLGFSWALNSGENRLTEWSNDPVRAKAGEILYLRDEHDGHLWSPTPMPLATGQVHQIRHGMGWTEWRSNARGLEQTLRCFVPVGDPVKVVTLTLTNRTHHQRRITATYYAEWLLGAMPSSSMPFVTSSYDAASHAILAQCDWNGEFAGKVAFLAATQPAHSYTTSRLDFLGQQGSVDNPLGLRHSDLGGRAAPGGETCAAYQVHLDLEPGATREVTFLLGQAGAAEQAADLIAKWREDGVVTRELDAAKAFWQRQTSAVLVETPDPAFNLLVNRWLIYQTLASRVMARAGFYQTSGAYGFRDQLQDVLALLWSDPARTRAQILLSATRQFEEGDVQHWWHPPLGRGVRTRCSDDFIWLPFVTGRYIEATGDQAILSEALPFLAAPPLKPEETDRYALFENGETATLLEHCVRSLHRMMRTGRHGLPLIGTGDWNDGLDRVGDKGQGESVWLAWFQIATIARFAPILADHGQQAFAQTLRDYARTLAAALEATAWDGHWYVRAFDDAGVPWGSAGNDECQIDSISQSWSVLCGLAPPDRAREAVQSACERLIHEELRLIQLLTPPFAKTTRDPGYIRAYPPGIRENGGQYTHSAAWLGLALAGLRDGDGAARVFNLINPILRTQTFAAASHYAREPYVLTGDVYGPGEHPGVGGWSWYTGAAGWTWQLGVEAILGLRLEGGKLAINPCLPRHWAGFSATMRTDNGDIHIIVEDPDKLGHGATRIVVDGQAQPTSGAVAFPGPGRIRKVEVLLLPAQPPP